MSLGAGTPATDSRRLFLIDGYSTLFRAFYAIRNLSNSKGEPTNAVYGFVNMLRKLLRESRPDLVGVALDTGDKTFRSERFAAYKAQRAPMPEDLKSQLPWLRRVIEAYRIPILEYPNVEADDVLATLALRAREAGYEVTLVTADKDFFQLVRPGIALMHTGREKLYDAAGVTQDFGVEPERVVDVLALMGDSVDNVPGVPGIGEKGARSLILEYGSLESLLDRAALVPRKGYRESLLAHREQALMSKELVTLRTDLPIPFDPGALRLDPPNVDALRQLWSELEFFSLLEELRPEASAGQPSAVEPPRDVIHEVRDVEEWRAATESIDAGAEAAVGVFGDPVAGLSFTVAGGERTVVADFRRGAGLRAVAARTVADWLSDPARSIVGHDIKETLRFVARELESAFEAPCATLWDGQLMSYVLRPALTGHDLEEVALERLRESTPSARQSGFVASPQAPLPGDERGLAHAAARSSVALRLMAVLRPELEKQPALLRVYREIEAPLVPVLLAMEEMGILLDREFLGVMSGELGRELTSLESQIFEIAGETFNLNSPQQLGVVLFEKLQYPVLGRTRKTKNYSTDAETLEELATRGYPLPGKLLRWRELAKLKSTYVDALPQLCDADGRVHTRYQQAVAATGRLSSERPNLQNIPIRTDLGQRIRRAFRAVEGWRLLVADYNQIELRILAHIANEEALIDAFRRGEDIHRTTAASVFGVAAPLVTADQRRAAKVINFGILYGMSAFGLGRTLGISSGEADRFIKAYLERFPAVERYMVDTLASAQRDGRVETLYGRVRHLPDIHSKNFNLRENARRMAINARIQGTAADVLKLAMVAVDRRLRGEAARTRLLLTVHDELVLESPEGEVLAAQEWIREEMQGVATLAVPLAVDVGSGPTWAEAKH